MIKTMGKVYLNSFQFTTDPKIKRSWPSRQTVLPGIEGSVTVQDFDRFKKDMRLTLTSNGNFMNQALKAAIDTMIATRGATYDYVDYTGIEGTVKILSFDPEPTFYRDGDFVLYEYTMELKIMTLSKLDGVSYGGS
jgi:hypothetical protein